VTTSDPIVIVCATDSRYVLPLAVMLRSVAEHLRDDRRVACYILYDGVSQGDRDRVCETLPPGQFEVKWIPASPHNLRGVPVWGRMPVTTYFKLLVPELLPHSVDRAIWLDCDMLVTRDIGLLWNVDLGDHATAAVQDQHVPLVSSRGGISRCAQLGISTHAKYFNAGVMLMSLSAWRREGVAHKALSYLRDNARSVMFWDQEGLNVVLAGKWLELPRSWNVNVSLPGWRSAPRDRAPAILHFAGMLKPWAYRTSDPEWSVYNRYLDHTAWAGMRPARNALNSAISLYERSGIRRATQSLEGVALGIARRFSVRPGMHSSENGVPGVPLESQ
jgi:lipopolysaccharide biosynthesis glycosyltransferase